MYRDRRNPINHPSIDAFLYNSRGFEGLEDLINDLKVESDAGCAIYGAALLESALEGILVKSFPRLKTMKSFDDREPLQSFYAKISMARGLGLIADADYQLLNAIRQVRNEFAHPYGPYVTFDSPSPSLEKRLLKLSVPQGTLDRLGIVTTLPTDQWPAKYLYIAAVVVQSRIFLDL